MEHLAIIIPTTPTAFRSYLKLCLKSLTASAKQAKILINVCLVVNNAPLKWQPPKWYSGQILTNHINTGFTGAVNQGLIYSLYRGNNNWYLVLNDDTHVHPDFLKTYIKYLTNKYSLVSGKVLKPNDTVESIGLHYNSSGLAFPNLSNTNTSRPLVCGTFFFLSKLFLSHQLDRYGFVLNPLYFAYSEDLELSLRAHQQHLKIKLVNEGFVTHLGSQTAQRGSQQQLYYGFRNSILTLYLLWPWSKIIRLLPLIMLGQFYMIGLSLYKRYWLLYPKIFYHFFKNQTTLKYFKKHYYV